MATVIKKFRERYQDMKLYQIGDKYPDDDSKRVQYLVEQGYLSKEADPEPEDKPRRRKKGVTDDGDSDD
ncbi:hypothetical protein P4U99_02850 [Brevibacillus agri]|uniref:hypothetical protein n=1 Tax=Brevibacillus agri TaxID=51101 RepID=UPI002E23AD17|nr:hypothetical protein [Brevibacillus agri]MED1654430.1 hypothetical protein [Brevibacillus agri]MED1688113.1 hypothetical protein [Brevibacillus agri]MED1691157.1 hypothetical protein [Brevibacillus agri]MED1699393.1 hypothetical protein [Brevibacillus agri]